MKRKNWSLYMCSTSAAAQCLAVELNIIKIVITPTAPSEIAVLIQFRAHFFIEKIELPKCWQSELGVTHIVVKITDRHGWIREQFAREVENEHET